MTAVWPAGAALADTCRAARERVPAPHWIITALTDWLPQLHAVLEASDDTPTVNIATAVAIAYTCHAPYTSNTRVPHELQPFRCTVERMLIEAQGAAEDGPARSHFAAQLDAVAARRVASALTLLLGHAGDVARLGKCSPEQVLAGDIETESVAALVDHASKRRLSLEELRRVLEAPAAPRQSTVQDLIHISMLNPPVVAPVALALLADAPPSFLEEAGGLFGAVPLRYSSSLVVALLRSGAARAVQTQFLPRFLHEFLRTRTEAGTDDPTYEISRLFELIVQLHAHGLIPKSPWDDPELVPMYTILRHTALRYSSLEACAAAYAIL